MRRRLPDVLSPYLKPVRNIPYSPQVKVQGVAPDHPFLPQGLSSPRATSGVRRLIPVALKCLAQIVRWVSPSLYFCSGRTRNRDALSTPNHMSGALRRLVCCESMFACWIRNVARLLARNLDKIEV